MLNKQISTLSPILPAFTLREMNGYQYGISCSSLGLISIYQTGSVHFYADITRQIPSVQNGRIRRAGRVEQRFSINPIFIPGDGLVGTSKLWTLPSAIFCMCLLFLIGSSGSGNQLVSPHTFNSIQTNLFYSVRRLTCNVFSILDW